MNREKTIKVRINSEEAFKSLLEPKGVMVEKPFLVTKSVYDSWVTSPEDEKLFLNHGVKIPGNKLNIMTKKYDVLDAEMYAKYLSCLFLTNIKYCFDPLPHKEIAPEMIQGANGEIILDVGPEEMYDKLFKPRGIELNVPYNIYSHEGVEWNSNPYHLNDDSVMVDSEGEETEDLSGFFYVNFEPLY